MIDVVCLVSTHAQAAAGREREGLPYVPCKEGVWAPQPALGAAALTHIHPCTAVALTGGAAQRYLLLESVQFRLFCFVFVFILIGPLYFFLPHRLGRIARLPR